MTRLLEIASYIGGTLLCLIFLIALLSGCAYEGPRTLRAEARIECRNRLERTWLGKLQRHEDAWIREMRLCQKALLSGVSGRFERAVREPERGGPEFLDPVPDPPRPEPLGCREGAEGVECFGSGTCERIGGPECGCVGADVTFDPDTGEAIFVPGRCVSTGRNVADTR